MMYTERAVLRGTSHVKTKQRCKYTTWVGIHNALLIDFCCLTSTEGLCKRATISDIHSFRTTCDKSVVSLLESGDLLHRKATTINNNKRTSTVNATTTTTTKWQRNQRTFLNDLTTATLRMKAKRERATSRMTYSDEEVDHEEDVEGQVDLLRGAGGPGMTRLHLRVHAEKYRTVITC